MCRQLSQILILLFLVLSPVSYASEAIPDFETECPVTQVYQVKTVRAALDGSPRSATSPSAIRTERPVYAVSRTAVAHSVCFTNPCSGRAPPQQ